VAAFRAAGARQATPATADEMLPMLDEAGEKLTDLDAKPLPAHPDQIEDVEKWGFCDVSDDFHDCHVLF